MKTGAAMGLVDYFKDKDYVLTPCEGLDQLILMEMYSQGIFPMASEKRPGYLILGCPRQRALFDLNEIKISRSMVKFLRSCPGRYQVRINTRKQEIVENCRNIPRKDGDGWIGEDFPRLYASMPNFVSAGVFNQEDELVGGLYGLCVGRIFCGESMFSRESNTSKLAFYAFVLHCRRYGFRYIDSQILNDHTASLGCREYPRKFFRKLLAKWGQAWPETSFKEPGVIFPDPAGGVEEQIRELVSIGRPRQEAGN